MMARPGLHRG